MGMRYESYVWLPLKRRFTRGSTAGVGDAGFGEAFLPQNTTVAGAAGRSICDRVVATPGELEIDPKGSAVPDDLGLGQVDQWGVDGELGSAFNAGLRRQICHLLEGRDVFRSTIRVPAVVDRVDPNRDIFRTYHLRPGQRIREEDGVASGHVGDRNAGPDLLQPAALRHRDVSGERRAPDLPKIEVEDQVLRGADCRRNPLRAFHLARVTLAVAKGERMKLIPLSLDHRGCGCGVDSTAEQDDSTPDHYTPRRFGSQRYL